MRSSIETRIRFARLTGSLLLCVGGAILWPTNVSAQVAGTSNKPLPDVLLLVDNSGSMERMPDGSLPSSKPSSTCSPGVASEPNRWGMLVQALTGNLQPYYSCEALSRMGATSPFGREYSIAGKQPYDTDYFLPYHRPMTGNTAANACVVAPYRLPGTATGVGPNQRGLATANASDFPDDSLASIYRSYLNSSNQSLPVPLPSAQQCIFDQAPDGQLDAARDYARFALMTFDNDENERLGVTSSPSVTPNVVDTSSYGTGVQPPFLGQWSYLRSSGNPLYSSSSNIPGVGVHGHPPACSFSFFEVGARNEAAPPWEGRLVRFPAPDANIFDVQRANDQIQNVLIASRPFGATPIDGMLDDARDYFWYANSGPHADPYLCRDKYIILLTDGAPNLNMRPSCGETGSGDVCPYPEKGADIAYAMKTDGNAARRVTTYVIGFSVNGSGTFPGDGFPPGFTDSPKNNCKTWYDAEGGNDPTTMSNRCAELAGSIPAGSTADACCKLNEIALKGSDGTTGPFFAESQADIVLSFGRIMANVVKSASTRTIPAYSPTAQFTPDSFSTSATSGEFIASFIPNAQRPWSGEIDRTRFQCVGAGAGTSTPVTQDPTKGDFMSANLSSQSKAKHRFFLSVLAEPISGGTIDSGATIRPFANATPSSFTGSDGIPKSDGSNPSYLATEVSMKNDNVIDSDWPKALDIDNTTCGRSKAVKKGATAGPRGTVTVPALDGATGAEKCTKVVWGFTTAYPDALSYTDTASSVPVYDFNVRCTGGASSTLGTCSVSGNTCTVGGGTPCPSGEVCVPECASLGAIFHANPTVVGPPSAFLREEGFRTFQAARRLRRPTLFAATIDGILHAFKALDEGGDTDHELWSFVPPAVLPRLASNYPAGNQILLDGSPVVREAVWERSPADTSGAASGRKWHTTLVAGLGAAGGGYYALNVTDADCGGSSSAGDCLASGNYEQPAKGNFDHVATGGVIDNTSKKGPHFLWQITDVLKDTSDTAKVVRKNHNNDEMVALFGKQTGTPAIGMVQIKQSNDERQIGVAILPGGLDDTPVQNGTCTRAPKASSAVMHDTAAGAVRSAVRQWGKTDCTTPVAGRGVTIVRLDNGEVIRHFGRLSDTPKRLQAKTIDTGFDSPMVGTPIVYPDTLGVPIQKVFIGDADGTLWRIDLSSTNPDEWKVALFQDLYAGLGAGEGQPIQVPPVLSTDDVGQLVINVATGDQENLVSSTDKNFIFSIRERRDGTSNDPKATVNWFRQLSDTGACPTCQARVTGPMVVFDRTLYFASYTPLPPTGATAQSCGAPGIAKVWGLHYTDRAVDAPLSSGGANRYCKDGDVSASGACTTALVDYETFGSDLIPGVTLRTSSACSTFSSTGDETGGFGFTAITPQEYHLSFGFARPSGAAGAAKADRRSDLRRPTPRTSTRIDSWSLVIE